jgi:D-3-phosphoglycerate dehydrogenase
MANILIADLLSPVIVDQLKADGNVVGCDPSPTTTGLVSAVGQSDILIVRSTKLTREVLSAGRNLSLVIRAGAGVDTIDLDSATDLGVHVSNAPGCNSDVVAELAIGHLIACDSQIVNTSVSLWAGRWVKQQYLSCPGLCGRTLGVIGAAPLHSG